jgi:hypothetical protein
MAAMMIVYSTFVNPGCWNLTLSRTDLEKRMKAFGGRGGILVWFRVWDFCTTGWRGGEDAGDEFGVIFVHSSSGGQYDPEKDRADKIPLIPYVLMFSKVYLERPSMISFYPNEMIED